MKKIIATLLVAVASLGSTAMAGDWYIGGTLGFMHKSQTISVVNVTNNEFSIIGVKVTTNEFSILPEVGYTFNDHWGVGGQIGYKYTNLAGQDINNNMFTIYPYARWTFFRSSNDLIQLFLDGNVGLGLGSTSYGNNNSDTAVTYEIGVKPGIALNLTQHFSVVAHVGFLGYHGANKAAKNGGQSEYGGFNLSSENLNFGLYYTF